MNKAITKKKHGDYKQITEVGSGTYGKVYKVEALDEEKKILAFKKITYTKDNEGFPQTALREIRILQSLSHKNVIRLHKIITSKLFDYIEHDLLGLLKMNITLTPAQLKCIIKQILEGVKYIHSKKVIHRDLKCANILLSNKGEVKIADFGLARYINYSGNYTNCVVTLWYRAPELLLGQKKYTTKIDMWSIGCVMAELILGEPLFTGDKEVRQCEYIFKTCGTPSESNWPGCKSLPYYNNFVPTISFERNLKSDLLKKKPGLDDATLDFIDKLLILNPDKRMDADEALQHRYFKEDPLPAELGNMPELKSECHLTLIKNEKIRRENEKKAQEERKNSSQQKNTGGKKRYSETDSFNQPPLMTTTTKFAPPNIPSQKPGPPSGDPFKPLPPQDNLMSKSNIMLPQALAGLDNSFMVSRPMNQILQQVTAEFKSDFSPNHNEDSLNLSSLISQKPAEKDPKVKQESFTEVLNAKRIKKKVSTTNTVTTLEQSTKFDEKEKIIKKQHI